VDARKDIIKMDALLRYIEFIPLYIIDMVALITSPKTFLKTKNSDDDATNWPTALKFFGFSAILGFILLQFTNATLPLFPKENNIY